MQKTINAILFIFAALLAGFSVSANAQEARAQVYSTPTFAYVTATRNVDTSETLVEIVADVGGSPFNTVLFNSGVQLLINGAIGPGVDNALDSDGLPTFDGESVKAGDIWAFSDVSNLQSTPDITLRVYENAAGDLAVADGEEPAGRTVAVTALVAGEFFLLTTGDVWMEVPDARPGTRGHTVVAAGTGPGNNGDDDETETGAVGDSDSKARDLAVIGLGVGVVGFMAAYLSGGDFSLFNFAPDFGYSATESGYSVNTGRRLNFRKDEWHLYAAAGQENANGNFGDFRYESGGEYDGGFWAAAFSETVQGETADYRFSLSADYSGGIWKVSPTYRLHTRLDEDETETRNSLNLESVLRYNRWTISPSAGFNWRRAEEFGDNARFNLSAVRRF